MDRDQQIAQWLENRRQEWITSSGVFAGMQFVGAALIFLFFTHVLAVILAIILGYMLGIASQVWYYVVAAVMVLGLCWIHSKLYDQESDVMSYSSGGPLALFVVILTVLLFAVPVLFRSGRGNLRRIVGYKTMDTTACAQVVALLEAHERRVDLVRIEEELPDIDLDILLLELLEIGGVLYLRKEPEGLSLTDELRQQLAQVRA